MRLYSTNNPNYKVDLKEAVLKSLAPDKGLYFPEVIPTLSTEQIGQIRKQSFQENSFLFCKTLLQGAISDNDLLEIINQAIDFPAPLIQLDKGIYTQELFHGPSLAFKDFGARFMAGLMSHFNKGNRKKLTILVATSGDTGGAVAAGFHKSLGIEVIILYPSGKVSPLQEKQLTTFGDNIRAIEVKGNFDDCQNMVKQAFLDKDLNSRKQLSSANSINIARLIPQMFYYIEAWKQLPDNGLPCIISVPSGNFGNLTAGLLAKKMGLPIKHFIAASNANDTVLQYLKTGKFTPKVSTPTISNAMDVGNPSNFPRIMELYCSTWNITNKDISGYSFTDNETRQALVQLKEQFDYTSEPHGAIGYAGLRDYLKESKQAVNGIFLGTAHPSKFLEEVESTLNTSIKLPEALESIQHKTKKAVLMENSFQALKEYLLKT